MLTNRACEEHVPSHAYMQAANNIITLANSGSVMARCLCAAIWLTSKGITEPALPYRRSCNDPVSVIKPRSSPNHPNKPERSRLFFTM
jgi:hypothetical protein